MATEDMMLRELGRRVQALRAVRGVTQGDLATRVGLSRTSVTNLEAGRQNIPVAALAAIAAQLQTTVGMLMGDTQLPRVPQVEVRMVAQVRCSECGVVDRASTPEDAEPLRLNHVRTHWDRAIEGVGNGA